MQVLKFDTVLHITVLVKVILKMIANFYWFAKATKLSLGWSVNKSEKKKGEKVLKQGVKIRAWW